MSDERKIIGWEASTDNPTPRPVYADTYAASPQPAAQPGHVALTAIMRYAEACKEECSTDPESQQAIRNGKFASIAQMAAQGLGLIRGPSLAQPEQPEPGGLTDERLRQIHHEDQFGLFCDYDDFEQIARAIEREVLATTRTRLMYIADMEDTLAQIAEHVGLDPEHPNADALIAAVKAMSKRTAEQNARIMEAVERFGRACMQCDPEAMKATRAEVERLLGGEA